MKAWIGKAFRKVLLCLFWPVGHLWIAMRKVARAVLLATSDDLFLVRRTDRFGLKIVRRKRKSFAIANDRLVWYGKHSEVTFEIPAEVSLVEARALLAAQEITPWFAEQLFIRMSGESAVLFVDADHQNALDSSNGTGPESPLATISGAIARLELGARQAAIGDTHDSIVRIYTRLKTIEEGVND